MTSKKKYKKTYAWCLILFISICFALITYAWFTSQVPAGSPDETPNAMIKPKFSVTAKTVPASPQNIGIPGEKTSSAESPQSPQAIEFTVTIDPNGSNFNFVYEISFEDIAGKQLIAEVSGKEYAAGRVIDVYYNGDVYNNSGSYKDKAFYGLCDVADTSLSEFNFVLDVEYAGGDITVQPEEYGYDPGNADGNITQGAEFSVSGVKVRYCQATMDAVSEVFPAAIGLIP